MHSRANLAFIKKYALRKGSPSLVASGLFWAVLQGASHAGAQTIVAENFNGAWTTPTTLATASTWGDDGATGDQQWHRNDYPTGWTPDIYLSNNTGADEVKVYLSTDGGLTYGSALATYPSGVNAFDKAFRRVVLDLGATTASAVLIKFTATADAGMSDIGLDNFQVVNRPLAPLSGTYTID